MPPARILIRTVTTLDYKHPKNSDSFTKWMPLTVYCIPDFNSRDIRTQPEDSVHTTQIIKWFNLQHTTSAQTVYKYCARRKTELSLAVWGNIFWQIGTEIWDHPIHQTTRCHILATAVFIPTATRTSDIKHTIFYLPGLKERVTRVKQDRERKRTRCCKTA